MGTGELLAAIGHAIDLHPQRLDSRRSELPSDFWILFYGLPGPLQPEIAQKGSRHVQQLLPWGRHLPAQRFDSPFKILDFGTDRWGGHNRSVEECLSASGESAQGR